MTKVVYNYLLIIENSTPSSFQISRLKAHTIAVFPYATHGAPDQRARRPDLEVTLSIYYKSSILLPLKIKRIEVTGTG